MHRHSFTQPTTYSVMMTASPVAQTTTLSFYLLSISSSFKPQVISVILCLTERMNFCVAYHSTKCCQLFLLVICFSCHSMWYQFLCVNFSVTLKWFVNFLYLFYLFFSAVLSILPPPSPLLPVTLMLCLIAVYQLPCPQFIHAGSPSLTSGRV